MRKVAEQISLALPTSATRAGPILSLRGDVLRVDYDCEDANGSIQTAIIVFKEVLASQYRQAVCLEADDITPSNALVRMSESPWLEQLRQRWYDHVGWQANQTRLGGGGRFFHFHLYFDDAGSLDVVAASYIIGPP
jgi:hypothetical protein